MSSICRLIVWEHSFLPIKTKTFAFYPRKLNVCLFAERNARFGPDPTVDTGLRMDSMVFCTTSIDVCERAYFSFCSNM